MLHGSVASPRNPLAHFAKGQLLRATGRCGEAIPLDEQAIRLSPRDSDIGLWYFRIGQVHLLRSRIDEATAWLEKAHSASPRLALVHRWLAPPTALKGATKRAAAELAEARRLSGNGSPSSITQANAPNARNFAAPVIRALYEATYIVGLRKAGVPEL